MCFPSGSDWGVRLRVLGPDVLPQQVPCFDDVPHRSYTSRMTKAIHSTQGVPKYRRARPRGRGRRAVAVGGRRRRAVLALPSSGAGAGPPRARRACPPAATRVVSTPPGTDPSRSGAPARPPRPRTSHLRRAGLETRTTTRGDARATRSGGERGGQRREPGGTRGAATGRSSGSGARTRTPVSGGRPPACRARSRGSTQLRKNVSRAWRTSLRRRIHNAGGGMAAYRPLPSGSPRLSRRPIPGTWSPCPTAASRLRRLVRHGCLSAPNGLRRCSHCRGKVVVEGGTMARGSRRFSVFGLGESPTTRGTTKRSRALRSLAHRGRRAPDVQPQGRRALELLAQCRGEAAASPRRRQGRQAARRAHVRGGFHRRQPGTALGRRDAGVERRLETRARHDLHSPGARGAPRGRFARAHDQGAGVASSSPPPSPRARGPRGAAPPPAGPGRMSSRSSASAWPCVARSKTLLELEVGVDLARARWGGWAWPSRAARACGACRSGTRRWATRPSRRSSTACAATTNYATST